MRPIDAPVPLMLCLYRIIGLSIQISIALAFLDLAFSHLRRLCWAIIQSPCLAGSPVVLLNALLLSPEELEMNASPTAVATR